MELGKYKKMALRTMKGPIVRRKTRWILPTSNIMAIHARPDAMHHISPGVYWNLRSAALNMVLAVPVSIERTDVHAWQGNTCMPLLLLVIFLSNIDGFSHFLLVHRYRAATADQRPFLSSCPSIHASVHC